MSPIIGLTDEVQPRLTRLGKIRLGLKVEGKRPGTTYPKAVDYFVFPKEHQQYDELVRVFGSEPTELRILIPVEDEDRLNDAGLRENFIERVFIYSRKRKF